MAVNRLVVLLVVSVDVLCTSYSGDALYNGTLNASRLVTRRYIEYSLLLLLMYYKLLQWCTVKWNVERLEADQ